MQTMLDDKKHEKHPIERVTAGIGSVPSLILHTITFAAFFLLSLSGFVTWSFMLLILTTVLSLEAIYLAIFIQMTVNRQAAELAEVSEDVEDIQEDIEEISEDVDEIQEDMEDIQEDIEEISEDEAEEERKQQQVVTLETLTKDVQRIVADLEKYKHNT